MFFLAARNKQLENPLPHSTQWAECTLVHSKYPEYSPNTWREQEILHTSYSNKPNWYVLQVSSLITAVGAKFDCLYQIGTNKNPWTYYLLLKYPCSVKIPPLLQLSLFFCQKGKCQLCYLKICHFHAQSDQFYLLSGRLKIFDSAVLTPIYQMSLSLFFNLCN